MNFKSLSLPIVFLFLFSSCVSQEEHELMSPPPFSEELEIGFSGTLVLTNGILIDGTGADPVFDASIVIQNGRIKAVGRYSEVEIPNDAKIIDVKGATILPGFINAHVHHGYNRYNLRMWAQSGVTTVRDLGANPQDSLFSIRDSLLKENQYARLVAAGPLVTVPDGYPLVPFGSRNFLIVTSPEDALIKVEELLDNGADIIKVAVESGQIFDREIPVLSYEELTAIVERAHERGIPVSAHVTSSQDLERALDGGVDDINHMVVTYLPDEFIQEMVDNNVYWVPTLELWKGVDPSLGNVAIENLNRFVSAGGCVALGTDYDGYTMTFDLGMPVKEIKWMLEAGMTPMDIIVAGTKNAAHVCNLEDELGTLEVGKIADILVIDGNPLDDILVLTNCLIVIHNGEVIYLHKEDEPTTEMNYFKMVGGYTHGIYNKRCY
ncbi:MAG: amidohydrolase family protein [Theionarchaea archaeon]|nr:amidohydrolase family protein [Theionarchaea archaeon]